LPLPTFRRTLAEIMSAGFDSAFRRVKELVADFRANETFYLSPAYQEQEARRDFIDKFWLALGWDVNHVIQKTTNFNLSATEKTFIQNTRC
jgi:hypothetical protein